MWPSLKPSQRVAVAGSIAPQSASTALVTGWISAATFLNFLAVINVGTLGASATVDASIQQAQDGMGTGAKAITGKALTQLTAAASNSNTQSLINVKQDDFDVQNKFCYLQLTVTPAIAASLVSAVVLGMDVAFGPASSNEATTVNQIVG